MFTIIILLLFLLLVLVILFVVFSELVAFLRTRVPFVPTHAGDIEFIVKKLGISSRDVFYDLGSGNGKVVFLVNKLSGAACVGFELGWWTIIFSKLKSKVKGKMSKVIFKNQNFFKSDWSGANYIYGYLYPPLMARVEAKFLADCKPGSIAIIRDFPFPNLPQTDKFYLPKKHEIYIYKKV
jgi:Histone methylation protein DOT1